MVFPLCVAAALPDGLGATSCPLITPYPGLFIVRADLSPMGPGSQAPAPPCPVEAGAYYPVPLLCFDKSGGGPVTSCDVSHPSPSLSVLLVTG